jgi:L-alanine-DL-glutamate epimerase-like enolase superfamily enzyme
VVEAGCRLHNRRAARTPIASRASSCGRRQFRPYFEEQSVDHTIIDVAWNGILESLKIAAMADACEVNVAPQSQGKFVVPAKARGCPGKCDCRLRVPWSRGNRLGRA